MDAFINTKDGELTKKRLKKSKDIHDWIEIEDLDGDMREVAEVIGIDAMRKLIKGFAGSDLRIRFPKSYPNLVEKVYRFYKFEIREGANLLQCTQDNLRRKAIIMGWNRKASTVTKINNLKGRRDNI